MASYLNKGFIDNALQLSLVQSKQLLEGCWQQSRRSCFSTLALTDPQYFHSICASAAS